MKQVVGSIVIAILLYPVSSLAAPLSERYSNLTCAAVRIDSDGASGTGFFVTETGQLHTAAHVVYDRHWVIQEGNPHLKLFPRVHAQIVRNDASVTPIQIASPDAAAERRAGNDLALLDTGLDSKCFMPLGDSASLKVGQHLIAIGFPAPNPTCVLYDGFLSAQHTHLPIPIGRIDGLPRVSILAKYDVLRVQMPVTPGVSGAPLIDDSDHVIGVMSEEPLILTNETLRLIQTFGEGNSAGSGTNFDGFDTTKILAELAWAVLTFETSGSGFAVPVKYLN